MGPGNRSRLFLIVGVLILSLHTLVALGLANEPVKDRENLPLVYVLATGGTIAGHGQSSMALSGYELGKIPAEDLIQAVPELGQFARFKAEQIANVGSTSITPDIWLKLAHRINEIFESEPDVAGIVITHGTYTLEETAYFLNLTVKSDKPVVLVGAQRPPTAISADGPLNLVNAVRTAIAPASRGKGVLVVLNDEINAARDVRKTNTYRLETFQSGDLGFLGYVDPDRVVYYREPVRRHTSDSEFDVSGLESLPRVDIVYSYVGATREMIDAAVRLGARGIVLAGTGAGGATPSEFGGLKDAVAQGVTILLTGHVGNGRVVDYPLYKDAGFISGDNLLPQKARILLMLALANAIDQPQELRRIMDQY